jgi:recombination protein RecT
MAETILSESMKKKIAQELAGSNLDADRFGLAAVTALRQNPDIAECTPQSVYNAVQRAAHDRLLPDGREGVITSYNVNVAPKGQPPRWEKHAQWNPMIYGIIKRLGRYRITVDTQVVYEADEFSQEFGDDPKIVHKPPSLGQPRGKGVGAYAIVRMPDGHVYREVMAADDIEKVRQMSKNSGGVWVQWWTEMWRKTVLRRAAKRIPIPDDARTVVESEDLDIDLGESMEAPARSKLIEQIPAQTLRTVMDPTPEPAVADEPQDKGEPVQAAVEDSDVL